MTYENYNQETRALLDQIFEQKRNLSDSVFDSLSRLMTIAEEADDYTLQGFTHFHLADSLYSFEIGYDDFRHHLARAIYFFQLAGEDELLARAYNYVAVDALNNNSLDVTYLYLMNAEQTCEKLDNDYLKSIIYNNFGQVYARMRNYKKAVEFVRQGNRLQANSSKEDFYYYQNMINGYFSEGILCALMDDLAGAEEADRKIAKLESETDITNIPSVYIPVSLLRLMIAILKQDDALCKVRSEDVIDKMQKAHRLYDYITDIEDLCRFLLRYNYTDTVRTILDMITSTVDDTKVVQMQRIISTIEIAYYEKIGDEQNLIAQLQKQYNLTEQQQLEQNRIYQYSIDLINIMREQQKERERIQQENATLQVQAQTDPLTGIPNRLMLDRSLQEMFTRASENGQSFGLCLLDINRFKEYNDTYGHLAGDICLQQVARAIQDSATCPGCMCARYGGDEFVVLFENKTDEEILAFARQLDDAITALQIRHDEGDAKGYLSVSQGICNSIPTGNNTPEDFLSEADTALYAVKKNLGRQNAPELIRLVHLSA